MPVTAPAPNDDWGRSGWSPIPNGPPQPATPTSPVPGGRPLTGPPSSAMPPGPSHSGVPYSGAPGPVPPRNGRPGLVVGLIIGGLVLLLGGTAAVILAPRLTASVGAPAYWGDLPEWCQVPDAVLAGAGTPNPAPPQDHTAGPGLRRVSCGWHPAESERVRLRSATVTFNSYTADHPRDPRAAAREFFESYPGEPLDGIGDAARIVVDEDESSAYRSAEIRVIKGSTVFSLLYGGYDRALLGTRPMPDGAAPASAQAIAAALADHLE